MHHVLDIASNSRARSQHLSLVKSKQKYETFANLVLGSWPSRLIADVVWGRGKANVDCVQGVKIVPLAVIMNT